MFVLCLFHSGSGFMLLTSGLVNLMLSFVRGLDKSDRSTCCGSSETEDDTYPYSLLVVLLSSLEIFDDMVEVALVRASLLGNPLFEIADVGVGGHAIRLFEKERHMLWCFWGETG